MPLRYPERAQELFAKAEEFSLRLGHLRGKTIINRFFRPSGRYATAKAKYERLKKLVEFYS